MQTISFKNHNPVMGLQLNSENQFSGLRRARMKSRAIFAAVQEWEPSELWIAQIGSMSEAQITLVCRQCMERCAAGSTWPPDLAEFVALVSASGANPFNLTSDAVMAEYKRWRNESYRYSGSDKYPWKQDVLYHICIEMRRTGVERNLTEGELKKLAENLLTKWTKHLANGFSIPPIRRQLAAPRHPAGPTPAQVLMEEYKRRKAAGLTK